MAPTPSPSAYLSSSQPSFAQFVYAFPASNGTSRATSWIRSSRIWRRGIPAVVGSLNEPLFPTLREANVFDEHWVVWKRPVDMLAEPQEALRAVAPALVNTLAKQLEFDWLLLGEEGTVFNLDVVRELVDGLDPDTPTLVSDHMWFEYDGVGVHPSSPNGSPLAPRCIKCGLHRREELQGTRWKPTHACPACTWSLLKQWDPDRPDLYDGPNDYAPRNKVAVDTGVGVVLSRKLAWMLDVPYMERCLAKVYAERPAATPAEAFSRCVFTMGVAVTDPGPFARDTSFAAFGHNGYRDSDLIRDAYNYANGPTCCDDRCQHRLQTSAAIHLPLESYASRRALREAIRDIQRARDVFRFSRDSAEAFAVGISGAGSPQCM